MQVNGAADRFLHPGQAAIAAGPAQWHEQPSTAGNAGKKYHLGNSDIKSLIYDIGLLELSKPLMLSWIIKEVYEIQLYVLKNN